MLRIFICTISLNLVGLAFSQTDLTISKEQEIPEMRVDKDFGRKYKRQLDLLIRTYPMALKAKELIDEYEKDLADIDKKRKKKKYGRQAHEELKDEFSFNIRDLYRSEGDLLMKLVHRETGMTVQQIIEKYKGDLSSDFYTGMAKIWGHNLNDRYDPKNPETDDWITEIVIQDILAGRIDFDTHMRKMNKAEYKKSMDEYRSGIHEHRKKKRQSKKTKKK